MFISRLEKQRLEDRVKYLEDRIWDLNESLHALAKATGFNLQKKAACSSRVVAIKDSIPN